MACATTEVMAATRSGAASDIREVVAVRAEELCTADGAEPATPAAGADEAVPADMAVTAVAADGIEFRGRRAHGRPLPPIRLQALRQCRRRLRLAFSNAQIDQDAEQAA